MFAFHEGPPVVEHASLVIHRPPEMIFRFIGERFFANYPRWSPEVQELRQIGSGPVRAGTRARQVRVDLGHRSESVFAVTIFDPGRRICFEGVSSPYRCDYELRGLSPQSSTLISFTFELSRLERYLRPFESLIRDAIRDGVERTVCQVKRLVEAEMDEYAIPYTPGRVSPVEAPRLYTRPGVNLP